MQPRTLSREEEAELTRSNKKVKDTSHAEFNGGTQPGSPPPEHQFSGTNTNSSFKDKLLGEIPGAYAKAFDLTDQMDEDSDSDDDYAEITSSSREGVVKVKLSKETKRRIRGPWAKAITVKLVGRTVGLNFMQSKLNQIWRPEGRLDCVNLTYGFFLVRFYAKDDLEKVIKKGPWFIGDHFLSLRPWEPFFKPSSTTVSSVAVWIRLNELPIELYEAEVLKEIGEAIGKILRIDSHTAMEARRRYARLCVQIDINRPLINTIIIDRFEQAFTYEGIQRLCFSCGKVGHKVEACSYTIRKEKEPVALTEDVQGAQADDVGSGHVDNMHNTCEEMDTDGMYGPWMIVSRKRHGQKGTRSILNAGGTSRTTEFSSRNIDPKNSNRGNTSSGGPNNVLPRRERYFKDEKMKWALQNSNPVTPSFSENSRVYVVRPG